MANPDQSPAVESPKEERARQAPTSNPEELDKALEATFPASDPVSVSHTSVSSGRANTDAAEKVAKGLDAGSEVSAPLVDQALDATGEGRHARGEGAAYRREAERLGQTVSDFATGSTEVAKSRVMGVARQVEDYAKAKPLKAAAVVASIAFLFGLTR